MTAELQALYPSVEKQLADREAKHAAHQEKMETQRLRKIDARDSHHRGHHKLKFPAYCLK